MSEEENNNLNLPEKDTYEENQKETSQCLVPAIAQQGSGSKVLINSGKGEIVNIENSCKEDEYKSITKEKDDEIKTLKDEIKVLKDEIKLLKKDNKRRIGF